MIRRSILRISPVLLMATAASAQAPTQVPPNCNASSYRQLDFWVGRWNVFDTAGKYQVATSHIEGIMDGCAIRETYLSPKAPGGPYAGSSISGFDRTDGKWHQTYIDTKGAITHFVGQADGTTVAMSAPAAAGAIQRMVYTPLGDGSVTQVGTLSGDGGKSWQPSYSYTYRRPKK